MPKQARNVYRMALRLGWPGVSTENGVGFALDCLPASTRAALTEVRIPSHTECEGRPLGGAMSSTWTAASRKARETAIMRTQVVVALRRLLASGLALSSCVERLNATLSTPIPDRTLRRWYKAVKNHPEEEWAPRLLPKYKATKKKDHIHPAAWDWILSDYLRLSRPAFSVCYRRLIEAAEHHPEWGRIPSRSSLKTRLKAEVEPTTLVIRRDGKKAFDDMIPAQERDKSGMRALEHVNADGHKFDVFVRFPWTDSKGRPVIARPMMMCFQDVYSGKILSWRIDETENGDGIRLAFADMVRDFGIPAKLTIDNGRAFAGKKMTGGMAKRFRFKRLDEEPLGVYLTFGVEVKCTLPYHGQSKPIERAFRDLVEDVARHPMCQGAYTGNHIDAKPEDYATRAIDFDDFCTLVKQQIELHNARPGRRSKVAQGRSLDEVFFESLNAEGNFIRSATEAQIQWLMLPVQGCKVSTDEAVITFMGNRFFDTKLLQHRGEKLTVRFDPQRVQDGIYVFANGALEPICHAQCIAPVGFESTEAARRDARARSIIRKAHERAAAVQGATPLHELAQPTKQPKVSKATRAKMGRSVVHIDFAPQSRPPQRDTAGEDMVVGVGRRLLEQRRAELANATKNNPGGKLRGL